MQCSCPQCGSYAFKRNGYTRHGKQNHRCLDCGRQFSLDLFLFSTDEPGLGGGKTLSQNITQESAF
ncbi:MAG: IS1 family transposase [Parachlamydiaceae bacterium]|nr:IS1 family transposase [Parachlamydiaceae bacterium]